MGSSGIMKNSNLVLKKKEWYFLISELTSSIVSKSRSVTFSIGITLQWTIAVMTPKQQIKKEGKLTSSFGQYYGPGKSGPFRLFLLHTLIITKEVGWVIRPSIGRSCESAFIGNHLSCFLRRRFRLRDPR